MIEHLAQPILLRPLWLSLLLLIPLILIMRHRPARGDSGWEALVPDAILRRATSSEEKGRRRDWRLLLLIGLLALALSGPSWRYAPTTAHQSEDSLVIILDVSLSMLVEDVGPDRLTVAKRKVRDILRMREGTPTALVAYAGDAHVVSPLTRDTTIIESFLPALDPFMMPAYGGRADRATREAVQLLDQGSRGHGRILLITDGVREQWQPRIRRTLTGSGYDFDILAIGTEEGGPVPIADRGYLREDGEMVIVGTPFSLLEEIASNNNGQAVRVTTGDGDLNQLGIGPRGDTNRKTGKEQLQRVDDGYWLLVLIVPLALSARRRGHLPAVALALITVGWQEDVSASPWDPLWLTPDQQGMRQLQSDPVKAARLFEDPLWRATAYHRAGNYEEAVRLWEREDSALSHYNRGNALAHAGRVEDALDAYSQALNIKPDFTEAKENRALLEEFLQQHQEQPESGDGEPDRQDADSGMDPGAQDERPDQQPTDPESDPADGHPQEAQPPAVSRELWSDEDRREAWLRRIPDDPAGLLERKFRHEHEQRRRERETQETDELW